MTGTGGKVERDRGQGRLVRLGIRPRLQTAEGDPKKMCWIMRSCG